MEYEELMGLLRSRRSIRSFTNAPVSEEEITKVLEAARQAPSGANSQPWEFIVIRDPATKTRIVELYQEASSYTQKAELTRTDGIHHHVAFQPLEQPGFKDAPVFLIVCGDTRTLASYPATVDHERNFSSSLADAVLCLLLAATALGLGAQYVTSASLGIMTVKLRELLRLPTPLRIYELIALGWPVRRPPPRPIRNLEEMVHQEAFDSAKLRSDEQMREFISQVHGGRPFR